MAKKTIDRVYIVFGSTGHLPEPQVWVARTFQDQEAAEAFKDAATTFANRVQGYMSRVEDPPQVISPTDVTEGGEVYAPSADDAARWATIRAKFGDVDPNLPGHSLDVEILYFIFEAEVE